ncbi:MAG: 30S ribosomal protein S6 [Clostridia bacterium]
MNRKYEAMFIIKNYENEDKRNETIDRINNVFISEYCNIYDKEEMGIRKLAYEIKEQKEGFYYYIKFNAPDNIQDIGKISVNINTIEDVIKHIIVKLTDKD